MAHRLDDLLLDSRAVCSSAFIKEDGQRLTAVDFDRLVGKAGCWLKRQGLRHGDRVAVWLVNRIEWLALLFACARSGIILVAVNTRYRSAELRHILVSSGARLLIMQPVFGQIDFKEVAESLDPGELTELEAVAVFDPRRKPGRTILGRRTMPFDLNAVESREPHEGEDRSSDPNAPLALFTTSGTTKAPKLVVHSQHTLALHSLRVARALGFDQDGASLITVMPFCGVFGLNSVLAAIAGGATIHLASVFDALKVGRRVAEHGVTHLIGSDDMFRRLLEADRNALASARFCGFAAFTPGLASFMRSALEDGLPLCGLYGSSEVNALFASQPFDLPGEERLRAGGRPSSAPEAEVRVRDKETGRLLGPDEAGELEIRAPTNFLGYFRNAEATTEAVDGDGFFRTGDIGYLRQDGTFVYVARSGDAIRLGGFLVDPAEIEEVLKSIEGVGDAQVVGVELDGRMKAAAFVVPSNGADAFEESTVIAAARRVLAPFKVPVRLFAIDAFPTTESANGRKIQKAKLRQMASARMAAG